MRLVCSPAPPRAGSRGSARVPPACLRDRILGESAPRCPVLVHLGKRGPEHADEGPPRRERPHHAGSVPGLSVGALLHVVGAQAPAARIGEVEVGQGIRLRLLEQGGRLRAKARHLVACRMARLARQGRVPLVEHGARDREHGRALLPGRRARSRVAHKARHAPLPGGSREGLLDGAAQALVRVGGYADGPLSTPLAQRAQRRRPSGIGLRVDGIESEQAPVAARAGADGGDERARGDVARISAFDVGRIEPDVGGRPCRRGPWYACPRRSRRATRRLSTPGSRPCSPPQGRRRPLPPSWWKPRPRPSRGPRRRPRGRYASGARAGSRGSRCPARAWGVRRLIVPTEVTSERSRYPLRWLPSAHASSAWASMVPLTRDSAMMRMSSWMSAVPSSNLGISPVMPACCPKLSMVAIVPSLNPLLRNERFLATAAFSSGLAK